MTSDQIRSTLRGFVSRFFRGHELADDEDFFASGYVNSMFAMQLVQFVEGEFGLTVESEDMELDNFRTLDALTAFVQRKTGAAA